MKFIFADAISLIVAVNLCGSQTSAAIRVGAFESVFPERLISFFNEKKMMVNGLMASLLISSFSLKFVFKWFHFRGFQALLFWLKISNATLFAGASLMKPRRFYGDTLLERF